MHRCTQKYVVNIVLLLCIIHNDVQVIVIISSLDDRFYNIAYSPRKQYITYNKWHADFFLFRIRFLSMTGLSKLKSIWRLTIYIYKKTKHPIILERSLNQNTGNAFA